MSPQVASVLSNPPFDTWTHKSGHIITKTKTARSKKKKKKSTKKFPEVTTFNHKQNHLSKPRTGTSSEMIFRFLAWMGEPCLRRREGKPSGFILWNLLSSECKCLDWHGGEKWGFGPSVCTIDWRSDVRQTSLDVGRSIWCGRGGNVSRELECPGHVGKTKSQRGDSLRLIQGHR